MRKALSVSMVALLAGAMAGTAQAEFSGNLGATSNYLWRGVTQTDDNAAISGGLDYAHESGFYVGTWTSNIDGGYELDGYFGFGGSAGDVGYDLSYTYYAYPSGGWGTDDELDFGEIKGTLSYSVATVGIAYGSNAQDNAKAYDGSLYYFGDLAFELKEGLTLGFHLGLFDGDTVEFKDTFGDDSYVDYSISLTKTTSLGDVSFLLSDTDMDDDDPQVAISWSTGFDL